MNESQVQPAPMPGTYGDPNYFNQEPAYYGYGSRDPQYFGYSYQDPNTRRYGNTPYTPQAYQAYQPKPAPVAPQPQGGLNTNLFAQQRGYSNPINQLYQGTPPFDLITRRFRVKPGMTGSWEIRRLDRRMTAFLPN